jgi:hypothetical protein
MKEIGLWGGQGTNPSPGPKKSYRLLSCVCASSWAGAHVPSPAAGPPLPLWVICDRHVWSCLWPISAWPRTRTFRLCRVYECPEFLDRLLIRRHSGTGDEQKLQNI